MSSEEECALMNQKLTEVETRQRKDNHDLHAHIRELRSDFSDFVEDQMLSTNANTKAIHDLAENTKTLVDAITAGRVVGNFFRWAVPIVAALIAVATWFSENPIT